MAACGAPGGNSTPAGSRGSSSSPQRGSRAARRSARSGPIQSTWWEFGPGWQPWFSIHPEVKFQPGATVTPLWANSDHLDLFVTGQDGAVASDWWQKDVGYAQWFDVHPETKFNPGATVTAMWA